MALYYVYALARPIKVRRSVDWRIFYIGKGKDNRVFGHEKEARSGHHCHKCNVIRKVWRGGDEIQRYILLTTESEQEALAYEREMIALHGRENLTNLIDGGEGTSNPSKETRERMRVAHLGKKQSPELVEKRVAHRRGKQHSPETRQKMSETALLQSPETRARKSRAMKGRSPHPVTIAASIAHCAKTYIVTSPDGVEYEITNLAAFCRDRALRAVSMNAVANNTRSKSHRGWKCRHKEIDNEQ
jgi:hypothetical protein